MIANDLKVSLVPCSDYKPETLDEAIRSLLGLLPSLPDFTGKTVGIKANLVSAMAPDTAAVTHPAAIAALVRFLLSEGAKDVIVGDSPGGLYTPAFLNRVYRIAGMDAVTAAGGKLNDDFSVKEVFFEEAELAHSFSYTGWLDSCDFIINFCKLKSHGMMGMSAGAKNLFGIIPGTMKPEYHFRFPDAERFSDMILDLDNFVSPVLTICDAVVGMEGNGPTQGTPAPLGLLLASRSPHALDRICADIIGLKPSEVPTLAAAIKRHLVPEDSSEIPTVGASPADFVKTDFKTVTELKGFLFEGKGGFIGRAFSSFASKALKTKPVPDKTCIGCAKCHDICPAKAITMINKKPSINRSVCIRCFCCQEFCPIGAMKVKRTLISKLLTRNK